MLLLQTTKACEQSHALTFFNYLKHFPYLCQPSTEASHVQAICISLFSRSAHSILSYRFWLVLFSLNAICSNFRLFESKPGMMSWKSQYEWDLNSWKASLHSMYVFLWIIRLSTSANRRINDCWLIANLRKLLPFCKKPHLCWFSEDASNYQQEGQERCWS